MNEQKRVYCLYRVSTKGQVEKDDIPMQKQYCREFAEGQGWTVIKEFSEKGVSGFKVSAADRDAIQEIRQAAAEDKFDILLVYMFDRLGRRDDETPFVVEWFVRNGIEVWSAVEGQQRIDNHVDKLMNYIRYWQASGESIKTSIRTKTRLSQIVQEGRFRGGTVPYGYRLEKQGRFNKKNHEVNEILVDENEAAVVRTIFEKYVNEGYGAQRLSRWLYDNGHLNRKGTNFANTTIIKMLKNIMYVGILRSGGTQSEIFPELQIVPMDLFQRAQELMEARTMRHSNVPFNSKGKALLSGMVYCAHCGSKLVLTTSNGKRPYSGGKRELRLRYSCHNKIRHPQDCDGQTGYSAEKLDGIVDKVVMRLFERMMTAPRSKLIQQKREKELALAHAATENLQKLYDAKFRELESYKSEIIKAINGTSGFGADILGEMIEETRAKLAELHDELEQAKAKAAELGCSAVSIQAEYDKIMSWAELYAESSMEAKKMILRQLINRVNVGKGFEVELELNISVKQFFDFLHPEGDTAAPIRVA
ncbi:recombinase family protein [Oscillibacter sp.]|uniref:recombinase family protein n=1 Tax=Oscillibacter sp. TaxID=1945593 RepID=UPI0028965CAE|nr:recombinase family protein [Oscillibacter sp.]